MVMDNYEGNGLTQCNAQATRPLSKSLFHFLFIFGAEVDIAGFSSAFERALIYRTVS